MDTTGNATRMNRTGIGVAPERAARMISAVEEFPPSSAGDGAAIAAVRVEYARDGADAGGSEPTPLLMDKLGERLAFERTGTRLYEALLSKHDAYGPFEGGPSREDIAHILGEELGHFHLLIDAIKTLGGDPTELTPSASVQLTASRGVGAVLVDPRTNLLQSLDAIAMAELTDNEGWETLTGLARLAGEEELAERCEEALLTEQEHLAKVRGWLAAGQGRPEADGEDGERNGRETRRRSGAATRNKKAGRRR